MITANQSSRRFNARPTLWQCAELFLFEPLTLSTQTANIQKLLASSFLIRWHSFHISQ